MFLSFDWPSLVNIGGVVTTVEDSDILLFDPQTDSFSMAYAGASIDLTTAGENIDALHIDGNGDLLVSTIGNIVINGVTLSRDEDIARFSQATQSWSMLFDGSSLSGDFIDSQADIDALASLSADQLLLSILGNKVPLAGITTPSGKLKSVRDEDILLFNATSFGENNTSGLLTILFDMSVVSGALPGYADISAMSYTRVTAP